MNQILDPSLTLLVLIAIACASLAHFFWGRRWFQLPIFWIAAMGGCLLIYTTQIHLPHNLPMPAGIPVLEAVLAAWVAIIIASRLRI